VPEPLERPEALDAAFDGSETSDASNAPQAPEASAFAPDAPNELRRDKPEPGDDDLQ
jgi:hypothetical protein